MKQIEDLSVQTWIRGRRDLDFSRGCYNPERDTTPQLDQFASNSVVFTDTATSHKSILYSLYPSVHKTSRDTVPEEHLVSPLQALQAAGFTTAGIVGGGQLRAEFGFAKGFDEYIAVA